MVEELQISEAGQPSVAGQGETIPVLPLSSPARDMTSGPVVVIGKFDGAHLGHRALADHANALADQLGCFTLALTFSPHPQRFFSPDAPFFQLMQDELRQRRLRDIGFDAVAILPFNEGLANLPAETFLRHYLHDALKARAIVVGADFRFGANRAGDAALIAAKAETLGLQARFIAQQQLPSGEIISSSAIRDDLKLGNLTRANAMLGYEYTVLADVIHGEKRGRDLGYPTANFKLDGDCGLKHGIYAVRIRRDKAWLNGVASFGRRPTFDNGAPLLEVHIFDFSETLYGERLEIAFHAFLREEIKFTDLNALIAQMDKDTQTARSLLAREKP